MASLATSLKANGDAAFKAGNYTDAITAYSKAIAVDGTNHLLYSNRSGAWLAIGDGNSALQDAESCIEMEPSFVKGYSRKGAALFALKQYDAASAAYRSGLDLAPADAALQNGLRDAERARTDRSSVDSVSACGHTTVARNWDSNAKVGHSAELVHHVIAFLRHREKIDKLWATYSTLGLVEAIPTIDLIETITSGQKDRYDPSMRQMSITATPITGLHDLYEAAEQALDIYNNILLNDVATAVPDLNPDDIHTTGLKGRPRAAQKAQDDYSNRSSGPGEAWLFDIVRGSIECESEAQIVAVVDSLRTHPEVEIIRLKNRFKNPTPPGFRDINMNIRIPIGVHEGATVFHICELQVHHKEVKAFAKANGSHHHYEYFRVYFSGGVDALATRMDLFRNIGLFNATPEDAEAPTGDEIQRQTHEGDEPAKDILSKVVDEVVAGEDEKKLEGLRVLLGEVSELGLQERVLRCQRTLVRARLGDLHFETFFLTNLLSINLQKQLKLEEAEALTAEGLAAMPLIAFEYESERWVCDMMAERQLASILCDLSKFEDSLSHLSRSWELSKVVYHENSIEAGRYLGELGNLFVAMGNLSEAAPHLEGQLVACRRELGDESTVTADALMQLAKLYVMEGKYPKAKALTESALGVYRRINGETDKKTAETLSQLGTIYQNLGQGNLAAPMYEQSLQIVRTLLNDNHADTLVALNNVANLHCGEGRWDEALPILLKGCEAARRVVGEQHHLTATFYNNLGAAVFAQAHFDEAKAFFEKSLAIREAVLGHDHPHTGKVSGDLGSALQMLGDLKGARGPLEHSLSVQRAKAGSYSLDTASTLNSLGSLLHKLGELEAAEAMLVEALQINRHSLGDKDLNVGGVLNNLGVLYRDMGKLDKGLLCLQNAVQVYSELVGQSNPTSVNVIGNLGSVMMRGSVEEERKQGRLLVEQAVAYFQSQGCGPDHPYVVKFATILAS